MSKTIQFEANGYIFTTYGSLETTTCGSCGIPFAIPTEMLNWSRAAPRRWFWCPAGHQLNFDGKSDAQKLKDARDQLARERASHEQTSASLKAQKAAATRARNERDRIKTRVTHGVCPCCNRTFKQLAAHMKNKHPGYEHQS